MTTEVDECRNRPAAIVVACGATVLSENDGAAILTLTEFRSDCGNGSRRQSRACATASLGTTFDHDECGSFENRNGWAKIVVLGSLLESPGTGLSVLGGTPIAKRWAWELNGDSVRESFKTSHGNALPFGPGRATQLATRAPGGLCDRITRHYFRPRRGRGIRNRTGWPKIVVLGSLVGHTGIGPSSASSSDDSTSDKVHTTL